MNQLMKGLLHKDNSTVFRRWDKMPRKSLNKFEIVGNDVQISRESWSKMAFTTYRDDYYDELTSVTWTLTASGYLTNGKYKSLHRYIMAKWYGEDTLDKMTEKGFVIDHMNNNGMDCRISNLEFLKKAYNTAKGQAFDVDSKNMRYNIAVNIFKDYTTGCYQVSIGCNDSICGYNSDGSKFYVNTIKLLYDCDFAIVVNDAENLILKYSTEGVISLKNTHSCDARIEKAENINLTEEDKKRAVVIRDGVPYLVLGTGNTYIVSAHYEEGWLPPQKE